MKIIKIEEAVSVDNPHKVLAKNVLKYEHATVMFLTIKKGEELKRHSTPVDVFFYIISGKGVVEIGDEREEVEKETLIFSPAKIPHKLINSGNDDFRVLVVKTPTPTTKTKILE
ncbi:MAG: cupin domain-containing protein [Candidatus Helarchaeota archaeon]